MKIWKRNAVVVTVFVFVCAGIYLNWAYSQRAATVDLVETLNADQILGDDTMVLSEQTDPLLEVAAEDLANPEDTDTMEDYFASMRLSRQSARDAAIGTLQETIAFADGDGSTTTTTTELENLVETSLQEAQIESLVIAKGYLDCVAYMAEDGISLAVAAPEDGLSEPDVALLTDIITSQSAYKLADIHIIEVK